MMKLLLTPELIERVAGFTDIQHTLLLACVSVDFHRLLVNSEYIWTIFGRHICGDEHWNNAVEIWSGNKHKKESPSAFARRVICPWSMVPQVIDLFPPDMADLLVPDITTRAYRIHLNDEMLTVDYQTYSTSSGWFEPDGMDNILTQYTFPARPFALDNHVAVSALQVDDLFVEFLKKTNFSHFYYNGASVELEHNGLANGSWYVHASVIAAVYHSKPYDKGGVCFFHAHTRRLLHFMSIVDDSDVSMENVVIIRPGEMWVLERWADPSTVRYYGPVGVFH